MRPRENPMKLLYPCLAHDPLKCRRFSNQIMRSLKWSAIGRKTGFHFC
jgi:hypothetical protein